MAVDGVGARELVEMDGEKKSLGMSELVCADGRGRLRTGWVQMIGNGWGEEAAGDERAWLRGRLRTAADGCGRRGCKGVAGNVSGEEAAGDERAWLRGRLRTGADGVGAREWLEMGREKKPLGMSELGCADGCGRQGNGWKWFGSRVRWG